MRLAVVLLAAALGTAGCSGDEMPDTLPPAQVRDGLAALYAGDHAGERDAEVARCFADRLTDRVPVERLRDAGVLDDRHRVVAQVPPLPEDLATDWVAAQRGCLDFYDELARAQVDATKGRADGEEYAGCLRRAITEPELEEALVAALTGALDDPAVARLSAAQQTCS